MAIDPLDLLKEYYNHLQHTEKQRSSFLQIYLAITGAGVIGFDRGIDSQVIKIGLSALMVFISLFGWKIMKKSGKVVEVYTKSIIDILCEEQPNYCFNRHLPKDRQDSKSDAYNNIFIVLVIFYLGLVKYYILVKYGCL